MAIQISEFATSFYVSRQTLRYFSTLKFGYQSKAIFSNLKQGDIKEKYNGLICQCS